ncbi:monofunctional biosynthetic peptidoglycan transglycosylase [Rodentibacter trehalosifermentans]|uniref:Biosynthetic peptidoglycan transglycosylase n=1 Tax=Rodentibacter trehalosifermentans TaxID=1908263 RepID=A0A1V3J3Y4_9PAST|nr:monofunctional biosynthetic peptidoglycan transglycosylase [Rodentibacter trehalosifermentans]OOF49642.1 monofunctional biosynthetic peptidoglycan transglycosylase [Rodentibacter trehalosifermentans]
MKKTKQILTAFLRLLSLKWWKENWQRIAIRFFLAIFAFILLFRFVPVPFSSYMIQQQVGHWLQGNFHYKAKSTWVSLENISPNMQLAVIAAEDQKFPAHLGFDFAAIKNAFLHNGKSTRQIRGGSTISQQTAKNLMLWHGQSWLRKGLEVPATLLLELCWSKKRILEVYLNIAEFGEGIFGVEAASRFYFKKSAKNLTQSEAALLAAVLPNPIIYKVKKPSALVRKKQQWIIRQIGNLGMSYLKQLD